MDIVVKMVVGSHLYGTNTENSDMDYAGVYLPDPRDLLLCKEPKSISRSTGKSDQKNSKDDEDITLHPLHRFLHLVAKADTTAMDMLFAPEDKIIQTSDLWKKIQMTKYLLLSKKCDAYLGYMRKQSSRYGVKAKRKTEAEDAYHFLSAFRDNQPLSDVRYDFEKQAITNKYEYWETDDEHIKIVGRKWPWEATVKLAKEGLCSILSRYASRTEAAAQNGNIDWKAMHHTLRAGYQIRELLTTGHITFPRPEAEFLTRVKKGMHLIDDVSEMIDELMSEIEELKNKSVLREEPDQGFIDKLIITSHVDALLKHAYPN